MRSVYTTVPPEDAEPLARRLVEERVAACVNLHTVDSVYRWQGSVVEEEEVALDVKTALPYEDVERRIQELHPYDVPAIIEHEVGKVLKEYEEWVEEECENR